MTRPDGSAAQRARDDESQLAERSASRLRDFTPAPNALLRDPTIPPDAKIVYLTIMQFERKDRPTFPSQATLAGLLGKSVDYVHRQIVILVRLGLVTCTRRRRDSNVYVLNQYSANLRLLNPKTPQKCGVLPAADSRSHEGAELRPYVDVVENRQQQDGREAPDDVVLKVRTALAACGFDTDAIDRLCAGGLVPERAELILAWVAAMPSLRADATVANPLGYARSMIAKGVAPAARIVVARASRASAEAARDLESRAHADREAAKRREAAETVESEELLAALPPLVLSGLERRATDELLAAAPAFLQRAAPSQARIRERVAALASRTAQNGAWREVVDHDELMHAQPGEAPPPAFSGRCAGCCQVRDFDLARRGAA